MLILVACQRGTREKSNKILTSFRDPACDNNNNMKECRPPPGGLTRHKLGPSDHNKESLITTTLRSRLSGGRDACSVDGVSLGGVPVWQSHEEMEGSLWQLGLLGKEWEVREVIPPQV